MTSCGRRPGCLALAHERPFPAPDGPPISRLDLVTIATAEGAVMKGLQRQTVSDNVTINQLRPERIDSGRQVQMARLEAERDGVTVTEARRRPAASVAAGRLGRPEEFGAACAFLCSAQTGYISGDNLRLDGDSYAGLV